MSMSETYEKVLSRKISIKSLTRHFAGWKLRSFRLDSHNSLLEILSPDHSMPSIVSLRSLNVSFGRHFYSIDKYFWFWIKYFDNTESCPKEIIMKFEVEDDLLRWEKALSGLSNTYKSFLKENVCIMRDILAEFIKEKSTAEVISKEIEQDGQEASYFTNDAALESPDDLVLSAFDGLSIDPGCAVVNSSTSSTGKKASNSRIESQKNESVRNAFGRFSPVFIANNESRYGSSFIGKTSIPWHNRQLKIPKMNIIIMAVGTRGDIQPFTRLGIRLQQDGHRVRLATHECFRSFILSNNLEFYPIAGDPVLLSEFMVKTGGSVLSFTADLIKEIPKFHGMIVEIMHSVWKACIDPAPSDNKGRMFTVDAIISNPVTYAHVHCAEALGVPLHVMFPQPWLPTKAFPHPLSRLPYHNSWSTENYLSYELVDRTCWLAFEREINNFRLSIGLEPFRLGQHGWNLLNYHQVPFVKMWSPAFVPKPKDWPDHVDIVGTFFDCDIPREKIIKPAPAHYMVESKLERCFDPGVRKAKSEDSMLPIANSNSYEPPEELQDFLARKGPIIFIGFGSMVVKDLESIISLFLEAAALAKVRVLVQIGWSSISPEKFLDLALQAQTKAKKVHTTVAMSDFGDDFIFPSSTESSKAKTESIDKQALDKLESNAISIGAEEGRNSLVDESNRRSKSRGSGSWISGMIDFASRPLWSSTTSENATSSKPVVAGNEPENITSWDEVIAECWTAADDAFLLGPCPHHWLFQQVAAVVHHGGAGTTAAGLLHGKPTWICPFFGDQFFWGEMTHRAGLGPKPCPIEQLSVQLIADSLEILIQDSVLDNAKHLGSSMAKEDGVENAVHAFYRHLPVQNMICDVSLVTGESLIAEVFCVDCGLKMTAQISEEIHQTPSLHIQHHRILPCCFVDWSIPKPESTTDGLVQGVGALTHELIEGVADAVLSPVIGVYSNGIQGAATGLVTGIQHLVGRQIQGGAILYEKLKEGISTSYKGSSGIEEAAKDTKENVYIFSRKQLKDVSHEASDKVLEIRRERLSQRLHPLRVLQPEATVVETIPTNHNHESSPTSSLSTSRGNVGMDLSSSRGERAGLQVESVNLLIGEDEDEDDENEGSDNLLTSPHSILLQSVDHALLAGAGMTGVIKSPDPFEEADALLFQKLDFFREDSFDMEGQQDAALAVSVILPSSSECADQSADSFGALASAASESHEGPDLLQWSTNSQPLAFVRPIPHRAQELDLLDQPDHGEEASPLAYSQVISDSILLQNEDKFDMFSPDNGRGLSMRTPLGMDSQRETIGEISRLQAFQHATASLQVFKSLGSKQCRSISSKRFTGIMQQAIARHQAMHAESVVNRSTDPNIFIPHLSPGEVILDIPEQRDALIKVFLKAFSSERMTVDFVDFLLFLRDIDFDLLC